MWIQVRTIDGKETRTVEDLSRLTKIESLRLKIQDIFNVSPQQQRLFYRGKQMEDGQTLFDYNVGLNDIVQLLIRSQTDPPDSPATKDSPGVSCSSAPPPDPRSESHNSPAPASPAAMETSANIDNDSSSVTTSTVNETKPDTSAISNSASTKNGFKSSSPVRDTQPPTSSRNTLSDPGIGVYKINELVDCRDVSIGAWFEACVENVTHAPKGQITPTKGKVGRPPKRTNGKLEAEQGQAHGQSQTTDSNRNNVVLSSESNGASTSQTDSTANTETKDREEDVIYHIKYDDYPENGVVEIRPVHVRPRARTLLRFDQLQVGMHVMVNYNMETPDERGFWFDAEIQAVNQTSRTNKELRVKILLGGPGDVIGDCKVHFLDEIYQVEKPGARALSAADGQFKRKSGPECKHCKADPDAECRFCSCCVCGGKQDAHMQLLCDECNMAFHIYCLNPPLATIPDDEDWYCPTCKNDTSEVVKAGEKLKASKKKAKMPSATTESQRDWGKVRPRGTQGVWPVWGVPRSAQLFLQTTMDPYLVFLLEQPGNSEFRSVRQVFTGRMLVVIHGRSNDGSYSLVLAGGFEDEVDRGDEFTYTGSGGRDLSGNKRIGEHSFDQTLTHMNRALALNCDAPLNDKDGAESRNWRAGKPVRVVRSSKGRRISKYAPEEGNRYDGIYKYPPGYLSAMANKTKKEACARPGRGGRTKHYSGRGRPRRQRKFKEKEENGEEDDEEQPMASIEEEEPQSNGETKTTRDSEESPPAAEPPSKRVKIEETFQLSEQQQQLIREDTANKKLWDEAMGNLKEGPRSFRAKVYTCPACRHDLGKDYIMIQNVTLQMLLDQFFPGYSKGR
ncbi:E3 ubiquitin-protein ligase UHRF2 [Collichthys lucidus]|uniref:E3 ubiquitin-protein ligase UHRF n=1 Tax=Collichthys lucidus TaxID=240159 RepID=A0A4U5V919_COLLU|nr:E3 ubiquitin-protein ligase UHRF2 [Collichthys lucidus]